MENLIMPGLLPNIDPDGLLEYSVVYTDRALNHMSKKFQKAMNDISANLKDVYNADAVAIVPGSGSYGMEAIARQLATDKKCLIVRNGWFSFRWSQIFAAGKIPASETVFKAAQTSDDAQAPFAPAPVEEVVAAIKEEKAEIVFATHVETASGMMLPNDYIKALADAAHSVGAIFVLDCVASGTVWVDMKDIGVDVLVTAPQKGWSGSPCCGLVMMSAKGREMVEATDSTSFAADLKKWCQIMEAFENGGHAYHATMPTDALVQFRDIMVETREFGFDRACDARLELGRRIRDLLASKGIKSVAAEGFEAPGVVVVYTDDPAMQNGSKFAAQGMQIAAGVPLACDEPEGFMTFRLGLFGLDKLKDVDAAVARFEEILNKVL